VLLEPDDAPRAALPVTTPDIRVLPMQRPVVTHVEVEGGGTLRFDSTLLVSGTSFATGDTRVIIGDSAPMTLGADDLTDTTIRIQMPNDVAAGPVGLQVLGVVQLGDPPTDRPWLLSNVYGLLVRPVVRRVLAGGTATANADVSLDTTGGARLLTLRVDPALRPGQTVLLLLDDLASDAGAVHAVLPWSPPDAATTAPVFDVATIATGRTLLVRLRVDGADSEVEGLPFDQPRWSS
jgi:hypothetical protein